MKSTGIIRQLDSLGRIVLPIELRRTLNIQVKDAMEIFVDSDKIVLRKHTASCIFCGSEENLTEYMDQVVCASCVKALAKGDSGEA